MQGLARVGTRSGKGAREVRWGGARSGRQCRASGDLLYSSNITLSAWVRMDYNGETVTDQHVVGWPKEPRIKLSRHEQGMIIKHDDPWYLVQSKVCSDINSTHFVNFPGSDGRVLPIRKRNQAVADIADGKWHHLALSYDTTAIDAWVDGRSALQKRRLRPARHTFCFTQIDQDGLIADLWHIYDSLG